MTIAPPRFTAHRRGDVLLVHDRARHVVSVNVFPHGPDTGPTHVRVDVSDEARCRHPGLLAEVARRCARRLTAAGHSAPRSDLLRTP